MIGIHIFVILGLLMMLLSIAVSTLPLASHVLCGLGLLIGVIGLMHSGTPPPSNP
jgi:hypothetical protein